MASLHVIDFHSGFPGAGFEDSLGFFCYPDEQKIDDNVCSIG